MGTTERDVNIEKVTSGSPHWFGYHDLCPWDAAARYLLCCTTETSERPLKSDDTATVGVIDLCNNNTLVPLSQTKCFNWQMGARQQWIPGEKPRIIFNTLKNGEHGAALLDIESKETTEFRVPVYQLHPGGGKALTFNFSSLYSNLPGYGYPYDSPFGHHPEQDGIWEMDLVSGDARPLITLHQLRDFSPRPTMSGANHWVSHLQYSPDGSRFSFLHRWKRGGGGLGELVARFRHWLGPLEVPMKNIVSSLPHNVRMRMLPHWSRLFTAAVDGSDIRLLSDDDMVSHMAWFGSQKILAWAHRADIGDRYFLFNDNGGDIEVVGEEAFDSDGHPSFSPDKTWFVTDTYPNEASERVLALYNMHEDRRIDVAHLHSPPNLHGSTRCDLHPRWSRDGTKICVDSAHEGVRQIYVVDVTEIVQ